MVISACEKSHKKDDDGAEDQLFISNDAMYFNLGGSHLSVSYEENYTGYWRNSRCGDLRFARIGINGMSVEINTGILGVDNMFGTINSLGEMSFPEREVSLKCEECDNIRPLKTDGKIDFILKSGSLSIELACSNASGYIITDSNIKLKEGSSQPSPYNDKYRVEREIKDLSKKDLSCDTVEDCKLINLTVNDLCNTDAIVFSSLAGIEDTLFDLKDEYNHIKWLSSGNTNGTSLPFCAGRREPVCQMDTCVLSEYQ